MPAPTPQPPASPIADNRMAALAYLASSVSYWRNTGLAEETLQRQRQTLAWRVLNVPQTGANLRTLEAVLNQMGAPKP